MRKGLIFGLLIALIAIAAIAALLLRPATLIGVTEKSLAYSVRGASEGSETGECRGSGDRWACSAFGSGDPTASTGPSSVYTIDVDDFGCWDATRRDGGESGSLPETLDGCITVLDLVRADD